MQISRPSDTANDNMRYVAPKQMRLIRFHYASRRSQHRRLHRRRLLDLRAVRFAIWAITGLGVDWIRTIGARIALAMPRGFAIYHKDSSPSREYKSLCHQYDAIFTQTHTNKNSLQNKLCQRKKMPIYCDLASPRWNATKNERYPLHKFNLH